MHDVLFNRTNSAALVGKVGVFRGYRRPVSFASYLLRLRPKIGHVDGRFLGHTLNTDALQAQFRSIATVGVSQVNINRTNLLDVEVPIPSIAEQVRIADAIDAHVRVQERQRGVIARMTLVERAITSRLLRQSATA